MSQALDDALDLFRRFEVPDVFAKPLAPNDNSKNQIYLGGDFGVLNHFGVLTVQPDPEKPERLKAPINLNWFTQGEGLSPAPNAQLILYPQYPEVRLSGFLRGCLQAPTELMTSRAIGRVLLLGRLPSGGLAATVLAPDSHASQALEARGYMRDGVFLKIPLISSREDLLDRLREIHSKGWIPSRRLDGSGVYHRCDHQNCGGYTLEAEFGIPSNAKAAPDFMGWELKAVSGGRVTLLTPEPTLGYYRTAGAREFMRRFGRTDPNRPDRLNFTGSFKSTKPDTNTKLMLNIRGYSSGEDRFEPTGAVELRTPEGDMAAGWSFASLLEHWTAKHAKACYVHYSCTQSPDRQYRFGPKILLGTETSFLRFLKSVAAGEIIYDPGIKLEGVSTPQPKLKARSQFRVTTRHLSRLYDRFEKVSLADEG